MREPKYCHHCTIPWVSRTNPLYYWDTLTADALEMFGLPGARYITDISEFSMTWSFRDPKDAVFFILKFGEVTA